MLIAARILFVLLTMFTGFSVGMFLGAYLSGSADGFTGSAIALGYGATGIIIGLILSVGLIYALSPKKFRIALIIVILCSLAGIFWILYRIRTISSRNSLQGVTLVVYESNRNGGNDPRKIFIPHPESP